MSAALVPQPYEVGEVRRETADTATLELWPVTGKRVAYGPGQFTMLYAFGSGEVPISVSGNVAGQSLVHTVRAVGPVTQAICDLRPGDQVGVRGAFGRGWPEPDPDDDVIVVAGGLGLAPLRPSIYALLSEDEGQGRSTLLYGGRSPDQLLFADELAEWERGDRLEVKVTVDVADAGWRGRVGVVPALVSGTIERPEATIALVCGPEVMMRFAGDALCEAGLDPGRIYLSMERNMRCAVGHCGHCQWGGDFVCRDGPVFTWAEIGERLRVREL